MPRFQTGHSGRPAGTRNKLTGRFLEDLLREWQEGGAAALKICRIEEPTRFCQIVASLQPKEFQVETLLSDASETEIDNLIESIRERIEQKRQQAIQEIPAPKRLVANKRDA
jgi:hypothetical protein